MADQLSNDELQELRAVFNNFDTNHDGWIDTSELGAAVKSVHNIEPTGSELQEMINEVDKDGNGKVDLNEFIAMIVAILKEPPPIDGEWKQIFQACDKDGDGLLTVDELRPLLEQLAGNLTHAEVENMFREADTDGDGMINFQEFVETFHC